MCIQCDVTYTDMQLFECDWAAPFEIHTPPV